ncbi:hypothetical protein PAMP_001381 [Pampus punctatissimus]
MSDNGLHSLKPRKGDVLDVLRSSAGDRDGRNEEEDPEMIHVVHLGMLCSVFAKALSHLMMALIGLILLPPQGVTKLLSLHQLSCIDRLDSTVKSPHRNQRYKSQPLMQKRSSTVPVHFLDKCEQNVNSFQSTHIQKNLHWSRREAKRSTVDNSDAIDRSIEQTLKASNPELRSKQH